MSRSEDLSTLPAVLRRLLSDRGLDSDEKLEHYFNPSLERLASPTALPGLEDAARIILSAVRAKDRIVVFGDYDCDGVSATAILVATLKKLGADVAAFIPERKGEGYGMTPASIARMLQENPTVSLIVTVDNGITAVEPVKALRAKGIQVVITDHHLAGDELPEANALVDPKVREPEEKALVALSGAGVAFFLARHLIEQAPDLYQGDKIGGKLLVLAGLATVTDIMELTEQNRILVWHALEKFASWAPLGLRELLQRAAREGVTRLGAHDFGFLIGPRINAAGRIASPIEALDLMLADEVEKARELAMCVDVHNSERKQIEKQMTEEALALVVPGASAQVIDLPNGHPGIAGIVAARVMEELGGVPTCVIACGHGSARAHEPINVHDALQACAETLERFGGHTAAAGFSVKPGRVDDFRRQLCAYCDQWKGVVGVPKPVDARVMAWTTPEELTTDLCMWIQKMEPFGEGNPEPIFGLKGMRFADIKQIGQEGKHLALAFRDRNCPRAVWWNSSDRLEELRQKSNQPFDVAFKLCISNYGEPHVELRVEEVSA